MSGKVFGKEAAPYLLAISLFLLFHAVMIGIGGTTLADGRLSGPDGYMRLVRVTQLHETGAWFDSSILRSNAPYGDILHWTRPFDVLLLAGTWLLKPFFGFKQALFYWGALVSPLLHVILGLAIVWATAPIFDLRRRCFLVVALLPQLGVLAYSLAGRPDHHMLMVLVFVISLGLVVRLLLRPFTRHTALLAGALAGFGLWISVEYLLTLAITFGALSVAWLRIGDEAVRKNLWHAVGLAAAVVVALFVERPPLLFLAEEYDRISVAHLAAVLLALAFWGVVARFGPGGIGPGGIGPGGTVVSRAAGRVSVALLGGAVAFALLYWTYPGFFGGAASHVDPRLGPILLDVVAETRSLFPEGVAHFGWFLIFLGPALVCLPYLIYLLVSERRSPIWDAWLYIGLGLALFVPLAVFYVRFASFAEVLLVVVLVELLARVLPRIAGINLAVLRVVARSTVLVLLLFASLGLGPIFLRSKAEATSGFFCDLRGMAAFLDNPKGLGDRPRIVLAEVSFGPELLYRTRHAVIGTPYHRNVEGVVDSYLIFNQPFDAPERALVDRRGIDLILQCRAHDGRYVPVDGDGSFYDHLLAGKYPQWLRPLSLPSDLAADYRLYEVLR